MTPQEEERAAIVAWLRNTAQIMATHVGRPGAVDSSNKWRLAVGCGAYAAAADAIERLDHLPTKDR